MSLLLLSLLAALATPNDLEPAPSPPTGDEAVGAPTTNDTRLRLGLRLHPRYRFESETPHHRFEVRRARLALDLETAGWLEAQLDADMARAPAVKDAFVEARAAHWLRLRLGKFKRPFSRIELTSSGRLPLYERGIVNDLLIDDANYAFGGRDLGAMVYGKLAELDWAAGLFNGSRFLDETDEAKDAAARLTYTLSKRVELGASGSFKWRADPTIQRPREDFWAAGLDTRLKISALDLTAEVLWGQSARGARRPQALGGTLYGQWRLKLSDTVRLRPVVRVELLDQDLRRNHDLAFSGLAGLNLHLGEYLRLMLQVQRLEAQARSDLPEAWRGVLQLAVDGKWDLATTDRR